MPVGKLPIVKNRDDFYNVREFDRAYCHDAMLLSEQHSMMELQANDFAGLIRSLREFHNAERELLDEYLVTIN
jgi:hypothetical protein